MKEQNIPLCVDLDHTLLKTNLFYEALIEIIRTRFHLLFLLPFWFFKGREFLKNQILKNIRLETELMPLNEEITKFCKEQAHQGRTIFLVSNSLFHWVRHFKMDLDFVVDIIAPSEKKFRGANRASFLTDKFGEQGFDYIGSRKNDIPVWKVARYAYSSSSIKKLDNLKQVFKCPSRPLITLFKASRIWQWSKNLLVFVPLVLSASYNMFFMSIYSFIAISLASSAIYILNDLLDIKSDRRHPIKKKRQIAAGNMSIKAALFYFVLLSTGGIAIAYFICSSLFNIVIIYIILNILYSLKIKTIPILESFCLTSFYILRLWAGSFCLGLELSYWINLFAIFMFLSLSYMKEYCEILYLLKFGKLSPYYSRQCDEDDLRSYFTFGVISAHISVLIFFLYIFQNHAGHYFWIIGSILLYWISSLWHRASRGRIKGDPIKFALRDPASIVLFLFAFALLTCPNIFN